MLKFVLILAINIGTAHYTEATCNECIENNGATCVSQTEFQLCFGGVPDTSKTYSCPNTNEICTKSGLICVDKSLTSLSPACGDISNCGRCEDKDDGAFACTSRTTYTMCLEGKLTNIRQHCPVNQMCDINLGASRSIPCVPDCNEPKIEFCDLKDAIDMPVTSAQILSTIATSTQSTQTTRGTTLKIPTTTKKITTTTTTETTPTTTENPAGLFCSQQTAVGRYPYPNDTSCQKFIFCFIRGGNMQATVSKCPDRLYFNPSTRLCLRIKPEGCI